ncbi:flagellar basal body-associated protein FliL [Cellulomonas sp. C5510]|uniref:flagellar basal body-associated FliL family protein n=1 Tax=Cellulomonas sp. C5510 TaxID=2871170 RepID=UPI001C944FA0|nr:flagellar basal body-associated FliL family protein [Cellulomonas sp. C5510]QZN87052.1 flagellar basal body-associated FliL family protein [Cellulomonas sp. C5510]
MPEQRIISQSNRIQAGAARDRASAPDTTTAPTTVPRKPRSRRTLVLLALVVLTAGAVYWFLLRPDAADSLDQPEVELGAVQTVEPININLADGRYLRLGLGLQLTAEVVEDLDPSMALDRMIALYSMLPLDQVSSPEGREALKAELTAQLAEAYDGQVVAVYITDYVYQ